MFHCFYSSNMKASTKLSTLFSVALLTVGSLSEAHKALEAAVFVFPHAPKTDATPKLDFNTAKLVLADRLDVFRDEDISSEEVLSLKDLDINPSESLFANEEGSFMIVVQGIDNTKDFMSSEGILPLFTIESPPKFSYFSSLLNTLVHQVGQLKDTIVNKINHETNLAPLFSVVGEFADIDFTAFKKLEINIVSLFNDAFNTQKSNLKDQFDQQIEEDKQFIYEISALNSLTSQSPVHGQTVIIESRSLSALSNRYGGDSKKVKIAEQMIFESINHIIKSFASKVKSTVIVLPDDSASTGKPVITHRKLEQTIKEKRSTPSQRKDVSFEFNLFLWFGIVLILLVVGGVQLLYSVGSEELPGILSAATHVKKA